MNASTSRFSLIGSSHLFGVIDQYVGKLPDNGFQRAWDTGVPATGALDLGGPPGWQGEFVLFNTPAAGPPPEVRDGMLYLPEQLGRVLGSVSADSRCIFSLMRGHEYAVASLVDDPAHADFSDAHGPSLVGRRWMSRADALAWVREFADPIVATVVALRQHFPRSHIVQVPPPPPIESEAHILAHPESFGALFAAYGIKPFEMRLRLYRLMTADLAARLQPYGIASLPPPPGALTPAGGLHEDFARGCLHGNHEYARLLGEQVKAYLNTLGAAHASV